MDTRTPLTPSVVMPRNNQVGKLQERLLAAARKSGVSPDQFQAALEYRGTELEDEVAATFVKFYQRASRIIRAVPAQQTSLLPKGSKLQWDDLEEGEIDLDELDYSKCAAPDQRPGEWWDGFVTSNYMLEASHSMNAYGSLGFAAGLLKAQALGQEIFPIELRKLRGFLMPRTGWNEADPRNCCDNYSSIGYFCWNEDSGRWELKFESLEDDPLGDGDTGWVSSSYRFVCPRSLPPVQPVGRFSKIIAALKLGVFK